MLNKSNMSGAELFEYYTIQNDEYCQILNQAFMCIGFDLYPMLEECERMGKRIALEDMKRQGRCEDKPFRVVLKSLRKKRLQKIKSYYAPCLMCRNLKDNCNCSAFPEGIPIEILLGKDQHKKPYLNQKNKIIFEPIEQ